MSESVDTGQLQRPQPPPSASAAGEYGPMPPAGALCANCDAPLQGPFCHTCGQPLKTPIRELGSLATDMVEMITDVDGRFFKSLGLLFFRPGRLTMRYLGGQRVRFIRPLRMYFGLSILVFLAASLSPDLHVQTDDQGNVNLTVETQTGEDGEKPSELTDEQSREMADQFRRIIDDPEMRERMPPEARAAIEQQIQRSLQDEQLAANIQAAEAEAQRITEALGKPKKERTISFGNGPWHKTDNPLQIDWLSDSANLQLNELVDRAVHNIDKVEEDPQRLVSAFLDVMPQTMFVLLPLFALLLKLTYLFNRRLYVEHLIVALHSHSFMFFAFLLLFAFSQLSSWLPFLDGIFSWLSIAITCWIPLYLLLMQKRVYAQGWPMTVIKYGFLGLVYLFLISFGMVGALLISLVYL
ncbi:MAG: DUF3667 domain-containing protein [Xanthomonadales bacterium]|nr:DUF3667 domain-containing protein [Xanthomonadales bacterium]